MNMHNNNNGIGKKITAGKKQAGEQSRVFEARNAGPCTPVATPA